MMFCAVGSVEKSSRSESADIEPITSPRIMAARRLFATNISRIAAEIPQGEGRGGLKSLDMIPCWYWYIRWRCRHHDFIQPCFTYGECKTIGLRQE